MTLRRSSSRVLPYSWCVRACLIVWMERTYLPARLEGVFLSRSGLQMFVDTYMHTQEVDSSRLSSWSRPSLAQIRYARSACLSGGGLFVFLCGLLVFGAPLLDIYLCRRSIAAGPFCCRRRKRGREGGQACFYADICP